VILYLFVTSFVLLTADEATITPVALLEVGLTNRKDSTAIDDKWNGKLGQGTRYVDLMNNDAVSGQKRKSEEIEESQESYVGAVKRARRSRSCHSLLEN
jgi:hypothetical protein